MSVGDDPASARCGFCGIGPDEAGRLIAGLTAWICDACVTVCYGIVQQVADGSTITGSAVVPEATGAALDGDADGDDEDAVMAALIEAAAIATSGRRSEARARYEAIWCSVGEDGDPLHVVTLAHQLADLQDEPADELSWDLRALAAVERLTDDRAGKYHPTLRVAGFRPSLHLNVADCYARLGRPASAREHLDLAEAALPALSDDGYGAMIRDGVSRLRAQVGP